MTNSAGLTSSGKSFLSFWALTADALSPFLLSPLFGMIRRPLPEDVNVHVGSVIKAQRSSSVKGPDELKK